MKFVVTDEAQADIERIAAYIVADSRRAASRLVAQLRERFREIKERPRASAFVTGFEGRQIRRKVHGNYLIFYRVTENQIEVICMLHGAMDVPSILGAEE